MRPRRRYACAAAPKDVLTVWEDGPSSATLSASHGFLRRQAPGTLRRLLLLQQQSRGLGDPSAATGDTQMQVSIIERTRCWSSCARSPVQGRAPPVGHIGATPETPSRGHLRPGLLSRRRATCIVACKG
jgi:hypothetical protein